MTPTNQTLRRPMPGNADPTHCLWYGNQSQVKVHIWGEPVFGDDSIDGLRWGVRRCLVCGTVDTEALMRQYRDHEQPTPYVDAFVARSQEKVR